MSIPVTPRSGAPARAGHRNPEIADAIAAGAVPVTIDPTDEHGADVAGQHIADVGEMPHGAQLVYDGDVITGSVTLAVILDGDQKESYFGWKMTTRVQPGESEEDLYTRVATVVTGRTVTLINDQVDALNEDIARMTAIANARRAEQNG